MKKRALFTLLALALCLTLLPTAALAVSVEDLTVGEITLQDTDGDGYYEIGSADELYAFAAAVNGGSNSINAKLTADITVNSGVLKSDGTVNRENAETFRVWTPIGTSAKCYKGIFDGDGHTISGLYFNNENETEGEYIGLFGRVKNGTVKNVTVAASSFSGFQFVGAIAGEVTGGTISDCVNEGSTVTAALEGAGGIVGGNYGTVKDCRNSGSVIGGYQTIETANGGSYKDHCQVVGGIAAGNYGTVEGCVNSGRVTGFYYVAGITGWNNGMVRKCTNTGAVEKDSDASRYLGGIVGYGTALGDMEDCANSGTVDGGTTAFWVGGILGFNESNGVTGIRRCANSGAVSGKMYVGGIGGQIQTVLRDCYNAGTVSGERNVGGIAGMCYEKHGKLDSCYNRGSITITGSSSNNIAIGSVVGEGSNCAGITNCYYLTGTAYLGIGNGRGSVAAKTPDAFASGEVAYLLNGSTQNGVWKQTLGENGAAYPSFTGGIVIRHNERYNNPCDQHTFVAVGACETCGYECKHETTANGKCTACDGILYLNEKGETKGNRACTTVSSGDSCTLSNGWYTVTGQITISGTMTVAGNAHLILCDGAMLTVTGGMKLTGGSLTIYAQSTGGSVGELFVTAEDVESDEGDVLSCAIETGWDAALTINGGSITATGGKATHTADASDTEAVSAGIYSRGPLVINGGKLTLTGSVTAIRNSQSISCGIYMRKDVTIHGGEITANGGSAFSTASGAKSAGIYGNSLGTQIGITGGTLNANGSAAQSLYWLSESSGIYADGVDFKVMGGTVTLTGGTSRSQNSEARSLGLYSCFGSVTIDGVTFTSTGNTAMSKNGDALSAGIAIHSPYDSGNPTDEGPYDLKIKNARAYSNGGSATSENAKACTYGIYYNSYAAPTSHMTVENSVLNTTTGTVTAPDGKKEIYGIYAPLGEQTFRDSMVELPAGAYLTKVAVSGSTKLADLLPAGYAYWQVNEAGEGSFVTLDGKTALNEDGWIYYTKLCTHSGTSGSCAYCGKYLGSSTSGGAVGGASGGSDSTVKNEDGSTTATTTDKNGTVTDTTKNPNGVTGTIVTDKNGTVTDVSANVPASAVKNGETVTLPIDEVDLKDETEITVDVPKGGATIEIPVENPTPGTVVVIVGKDGTETIVPGSKVTENGIEVTLTEDSTIKVIDNSKNFGDVPTGAYFANAVKWAAARNITGGVTGNTFAPHASCTRAQLVTFLWRTAGQPKAKSTSGMTDVAHSSYYADAVHWAAELGLVGGYGNGLFGVNDTITRQQMAVILYRFAQAMGMDVSVGEDTNILSYNDVFEVSEYAVEAMQWAVNAGILQGNNGNLNPTAPCTRGQIVTLLYRLLGK